MSSLDKEKFDALMEALAGLTFDGRPFQEAMREDPSVFEAVRRIVLQELEKILYDPNDDDTARRGSKMALEIADDVLRLWGPRPQNSAEPK